MKKEGNMPYDIKPSKEQAAYELLVYMKGSGSGENGRNSFAYRSRLAAVNYQDAQNVRRYMEAYAKEKNPDSKEQLRMLKLKFFHAEDKSVVYNEIAEFFVKDQKPSLAYMCWSESLRLCPRQPEIFEKVTAGKGRDRVVYPEELKPDTCAVSIIMPTMKWPREVENSIKGILNQTMQDFELIVINDGGSDALDETIKKFSSDKIKYIKFPENRGVSAARNEGILQASGEFIAYCDDDDFYCPDHLETLVNELRKGDVQFVYANTLAVNGDYNEDAVYEYHGDLFIWDEDFRKEMMVQHPFFVPVAVMHRKDIVKETGLFNEDLRSIQDWDFFLRVALKFPLKHVSKFTSEYRHNKKNSVNDRITIYFILNLLQNYYNFYEGDIALIKYYLENGKRCKAYNIYETVKNKYDQGFKIFKVLDELMRLSRCFKDKKFINNLHNDYLAYNTKFYVKNFKLLEILSHLLHTFPHGLVASCIILLRKIQRCFRKTRTNRKLRDRRGFGYKPYKVV